MVYKGHHKKTTHFMAIWCTQVLQHILTILYLLSKIQLNLGGDPRLVLWMDELHPLRFPCKYQQTMVATMVFEVVRNEFCPTGGVTYFERPVCFEGQTNKPRSCNPKPSGRQLLREFAFLDPNLFSSGPSLGTWLICFGERLGKWKPGELQD